MTRLKKSLMIAGGTGLVCLISAIALLLFPNSLFAHHKKYKRVTVYSGKPINESYNSLLDQSLQLISKCEIFDSTYSYDIFLTEGVWYKNYAEALLGEALAQSIDNNILLNGSVNVAKNELGSSSKRDLMQTITHEMVHCLMLHKFGMLKINPLHRPPLWKVEGYPEFVALQNEITGSNYNFFQTVARLKSFIEKGDEWIEIKPGFWDPLAYFKARVLVEYLITKKKMTLDQIIDSKVRENDVYNELMAWHQKQQ